MKGRRASSSARERRRETESIINERFVLVAPPLARRPLSLSCSSSPPSSLSLSFSLALSLSPPTNKKNSATIAWREEYKPDEITFDDIKALNTGRLELSKDRDVDGRPLVFFRLR